MFALGRRPMLAVLALLPALFATACTAAVSPPPQLPSTVAVGLLTAKTGANAALGAEAVRGAELAIDVVNNPYPDLPLPLGPSVGLTNGVKLTLSVADTQSAPERVEEQASNLLKDGVVGLVLADDTADARAAGHQADISGVALIDATSTADLFADLNRSGHFRIQPSDRSAVQTALGLLYREHALGRTVDRIAVAGGTASVQNEQAAAIRTAIGDLGQADGYSPGPALSLAPNGPSATELAATVVDSRSNVVFAVVTNSQEAAAAVDLAVRLKGVVPVVGIGPGVAALDTAKAAQSDVLRTTGWSAEYTRRNPVAAVVAQLYERRYAAKLTEVAASTFTATLALAMATDSAKGLTRGDVRGSVQQLSVAATQTIMPWDGIRFDGNGNNQLAAAVVEQRLAAGFQVIQPVELAATALAWP